MKCIRPVIATILLLAAGNALAFEAKNATATFPSPTIGDGYVTLTSDKDDTLTGLTSPCCKAVELHSMSMKGGIMSMRKLDTLDVTAGKPVTIAGEHGMDDSMHIMLMQIDHAMKPGEQFPITFHFAKQGDQKVTFTVVARGHQ